MAIAMESTKRQINFAWLEITPSCQLQCVHCYRESAPGLGHGRLKAADWLGIITSLHKMGTQFIQFIGGEPTIHPHFCEFIEHAAKEHLRIEVYTNMLSISSRMWDLFVQHNVRLATSFYSDQASIHESITTVTRSFDKTVTNITKALNLGLKLRVGIVNMREDQNSIQTKQFLHHLGVDSSRIGTDRLRGVGRGAQSILEDPIAALCGKCVISKCVITSDGTVFPCVFSRSFPVGNILDQSLEDIIHGQPMQSTIALLTDAFEQRTNISVKPLRDDDDDDDDDDEPDPLDCDPECDPRAFPPCPPDCCPETVADCEPTEE